MPRGIQLSLETSEAIRSKLITLFLRAAFHSPVSAYHPTWSGVLLLTNFAYYEERRSAVERKMRFGILHVFLKSNLASHVSFAALSSGRPCQINIVLPVSLVHHASQNPHPAFSPRVYSTFLSSIHPLRHLSRIYHHARHSLPRFRNSNRPRS